MPPTCPTRPRRITAVPLPLMSLNRLYTGRTHQATMFPIVSQHLPLVQALLATIMDDLVLVNPFLPVGEVRTS